MAPGLTGLRRQVRQRLLQMAEPGYRDFVAGLIPTMDRARILGVRTPALRAYAGELRRAGQAPAYWRLLPHAY